MIDEQQNVDEQQQLEGRLVLPTDSEQHAVPSKEMQKAPILSHAFLLSSSVPLLSPMTKLRYLWQRDPAYKVVMVVTVVLLIAGLISGTFATNMLYQWSEFFLHNGPVTVLPQNAPTGITAQGTVDFHPTFPTPGGGQGSTDSSQPPMGPTPSLQNTPALTPTLQPTPTPTQQGGQLIIQITSIPTQVSNNSVVPVQVTANEPGVVVRLYVNYNVPPGFYTGRIQVTDGNGDATLSWVVNVFTIDRRPAVAHVVAIGQDQNGQQASSQVFTVEIVG